MNIQDFEFRFTFIKFADKENKVGIFFYPLSKGGLKGGMITTLPDGNEMGAEYEVKMKDGNLYIGWMDIEFLFTETKLGFDLINDTGAKAYSFIRPVQ